MVRQRKASEQDAALAKCPTGIRGLDEIAGGGLPRGRPTLVCGGTGCGKMLLAVALTGELSPPALQSGRLLPALEWLTGWMGKKHHLTVHLTPPRSLCPAFRKIPPCSCTRPSGNACSTP